MDMDIFLKIENQVLIFEYKFHVLRERPCVTQ